MSPILFLIYTRDIFFSLQGVTPSSYVDDIRLSTSSTSLKKNSKVLERKARRLIDLGKKNSIAFDLAKTDLVHFLKGKGSDCPVILLNGDIIRPAKKAIR